MGVFNAQKSLDGVSAYPASGDSFGGECVRVGRERGIMQHDQGDG